MAKTKKAIRSFRKAIDLQKETVGEKHKDYAHTLALLGDVFFYNKGNKKDA